jgi:O-Antigen ligase
MALSLLDREQARSLLDRDQARDFLEVTPGRNQGAPGRLLVLYGRLVGPLLCGYMFFDKAFAYIHLPGTPLYVGEIVITIGVLGVLSATGYLRVPLREEPVLAILTAWFLWGFIRFLPGLQAYGIMAVRDFALCYYCLFAYFIVAALARAPEILDAWIAKFSLVLPWLLVWLPFALIVVSFVHHAPSVPFSGGVSVLNHEPGNAGIAAIIALGYMWLFPNTRSARSRAVLSVIALVTIALAATQNRASLIGGTAGVAAGLVFLSGRERWRLIVRGVAVVALGLGLAIGLSVQIPDTSGAYGRAFSVSQLVDNVASIGSGGGAGGLGGTVAGRDQLWSLVFHQQLVEGRLFDGLGFGVNLPYLVGDTQVTDGPNPLRSPHNSHDDVLARMGLIGLSLWVILWLGWYWQLVTGCRRLARRELHARRQVAVLCMMVVSTILVTSYFSPQLEGAQIAALQWTAFGVGIAVTSSRGWFGRSASTCPAVPQHLIQPVLAGPKPREREVIELSLWHDLYDDALAIRKACPVLGELLANWDGQLTDETRDLVVSHIEECQACAHHRPGTLRAASFSRLLPLTPVPPELRERVLSCCPSTAEDAAAYRQRGSWASIRANPGMAIAVVAVALWAVAAVSATLLTFAGSHAAHAHAAQPAGRSSAHAHAPRTSAGTSPRSPAATSAKPSNSLKPSESPSPSSTTSPSSSASATP